MLRIPKGLIKIGIPLSRLLGWFLGVGVVLWFLMGGNSGGPVWLSFCLVLFGALLIWTSLRLPKRGVNHKRFLQSWFPGIFASNYSPSPLSPERTAEDVMRIVKREFPAEEFATVMTILNEYGARYNDNPSPTRLAALKLANGSVPRLRALIESAKRDYRDVITPAVFPSYSKIGRDLSERKRRKILESERQQYEDWLQH